ncbi:BofC-like protein [Mobilisporobacter senegalensis]|uniref:BofC-like protein n=1 Tax=Mobilisporobacter senegalensis TaxID=1329262 RepID=A0A3N1XRM0_9FIRM|nr:BofC C-terminal domain-containing protein [Mobilisporobacter senegalensis]ROR29320.1 BofC-like protein [Mobilisporobacter senegalensis]
MKMKKAYIIITSLCAIIILFSGSYYLSYKAALEQFNNNATQKDSQLVKTVEENKLENQEEVMEVDYVVETVKPNTKYTLETYNVKENSFSKEILGTPDFLIGLTREEIITYLSNYMKDVPIEEFEKGLISYELVSFSSKEVVLRKTYNSDNIKYKYYLVVLDGYITVYYSDKKTVYEYTDIELTNLSEEEQNKLVDGYYVKDQEELYGILEGYTS